ncbi:uncharacterized protein LOC126664461 [Mercurialis annua]|uniref:uncharacterized protein LOC126664461 n=1 Tax=Mercurialis annua TaxID=3986 RepID=UPI0021604669|nr:uncharacterized protein LOC126664461 [Mercurialis annua]
MELTNNAHINQMQTTKGYKERKSFRGYRTGEEIEQEIDSLGFKKAYEVGAQETNAQKSKHHGWHMKSIFWDLPYWKTNMIRHNLDVMHTEKNARELGREPTHAEVHKRMHTLKADPTRFVDERARIAAERFEQEMMAATQTSEGSTTSTPVDPDEVYLAVEGVRKRRIYGLGSVGSEYVASQRGTSSRRAGSSAQTMSPADDARFRTDLIAQFADTIRDQVQIAVAAAMQQMQQRAPGDVLPTPPPPAPPATDDVVPDDDVKDL